MLEVETHRYLKDFLIKYPSDWDHIYSFGRIISTFLRKGENLLINSEIFLTDKWYSAALIALFLNKTNSKFVISSERIQLIINDHLPLLKRSGFNFLVKNNQIIFPTFMVDMININNLINDFGNYNFKDQNIIFTEVNHIKKDINTNLRIFLYKKDWFQNYNKLSYENEELKKTYNLLKEKFFFKAFRHQQYIELDSSETFTLKKIFIKYGNSSEKFCRLKNAIQSGWAFWVILDHQNFEWSLQVEPIDEINEIKQLLLNNNLIFLSSQRKDSFFQNNLKKHNIKVQSVINFKSFFIERNILIYVPSRLMLPNNPLFVKSTIDKCIKFSFLSKGKSIFLLDDNNFKIKLATELASIYGQRVLLEDYPIINNQILCSSYEWWIKNLHLISPPNQIIIPLLPFPNMSEPLNQLTVAFIRNQSKNWFREFMLPESFLKIDQAISPLRKNAGKVIFLDGRINNRSWGREIIEMIQPQKEINFMFPFD